MKFIRAEIEMSLIKFSYYHESPGSIVH